MGVGGQVFNMENQPIVNLSIHPLDLDTITGSAPDIGPSGYVFNLGDHPIGSVDTIWVFVHDGSGSPLSDPVYFSTSTECNENFVMVNWRQVREQ
jgi:hypothetical protein